MSLYKSPYEYNKDEDIIFGGWAIALAIGTGIIELIGGIYSIFYTRDLFMAHGLKPDYIPCAHLIATSIASAVALFFGILNLLAYARNFKLPKHTYKFKK